MRDFGNEKARADIAWGIKEVLKDPQRAKMWDENGRKRVLEYFTWRKVAEQTGEIFTNHSSQWGIEYLRSFA